MEELTLTTPALLFSAVSLILLAYTNRFLSYAQLVRTLKEQHLQHPSKVTRAQIDNLLLIGSLGVSIWEIQISVRALEIHLHDMEK